MIVYRQDCEVNVGVGRREGGRGEKEREEGGRKRRGKGREREGGRGEHERWGEREGGRGDTSVTTSQKELILQLTSSPNTFIQRS